ncbi:MAG: peptide deformylase [Patescibacteria group bacterium]|jgi:peptide deformylase
MKILTHPNKILSARSKPVDIKHITSQKTQKLVADMVKMMLKADGAGLAAPQIGQGLRLAVINTKDGPLIIFNPEITKKSLTKEWGEEGCLSVPGFFGEVRRHKKITCEYFNEKGEKKTIKAEGLLARVIQHETDHLDGILFITKARNLKNVLK